MSSFYEPLRGIFIPRNREDTRSPDRLRAHYLVERRIADRVRAARTPEERRAIFATMYDDLFAQVPDHPRIAAKGASSRERERDLDWSMAQLRPYLFDGCTFLEVGAGDCALSARVAQRAGRVHAVDISRQAQGKLPGNVSMVITDGRAIDVAPGSVDVAFSDQLMEHLHPDDAIEQLRNIHRALKPGGVYMCVTPNRIYGPSDISAFFDDEARGFHLKEYTLGEMLEIFARAGFPRAHVYIGARGVFVRCPSFVVRTLERVLGAMPPAVRRKVADLKVFRALLGLRVAGIKG
ncbi:MAG: methyltransferase domain-containing protein [Usitatibacter sp.]